MTITWSVSVSIHVAASGTISLKLSATSRMTKSEPRNDLSCSFCVIVPRGVVLWDQEVLYGLIVLHTTDGRAVEWHNRTLEI